MDEDDNLGWNRDQDLYGNEVYRPNLNQAALFMELICNGTMPQLEWRNPGKRVPAEMQLNSSRKSSISGPQMPSPKESPAALSNKPLQNKPQVVPASPFDFDDSESVQAAETVHALSISPIKLEPRKRVVGSIDNALNAVQAGIDKSKNGTTTLPSPSTSNGASASTELQTEPKAALPLPSSTNNVPINPVPEGDDSKPVGKEIAAEANMDLMSDVDMPEVKLESF